MGIIVIDRYSCWKCKYHRPGECEGGLIPGLIAALGCFEPDTEDKRKKKRDKNEKHKRV